MTHVQVMTKVNATLKCHFYPGTVCVCGCLGTVFVAVCILLDAGGGDHAVPAHSEGVWTS